jgi:hypothetical protein
VLRTHDAAGFRVRHPARTVSFTDRVFLGVTSDYALTVGDMCEMEPPCALEAADLRTGDVTVFGLPYDYSVYEAAFSAAGDEALVYTHVTGGTVGDVMHLDLRTNELQPIPGASSIGEVSHLSWTGDGSGAFFESGGAWAYWSPGGGIELLRKTTGVAVVGVA